MNWSTVDPLSQSKQPPEQVVDYLVIGGGRFLILIQFYHVVKSTTIKMMNDNDATSQVWLVWQ